MSKAGFDIIRGITNKYLNKDFEYLPKLNICHDAQGMTSRIYFEDYLHAYNLIKRLVEKNLISTFIAFPIPDNSSDNIGDWFALEKVNRNKDSDYLSYLVQDEGFLGIGHVATNEKCDFFFNIYEDDSYALTAKDEIFQALGTDNIELNLSKLIDDLKLDPEITQPHQYWIARYLWGDKWLNAFEVNDQ